MTNTIGQASFVGDVKAMIYHSTCSLFRVRAVGFLVFSRCERSMISNAFTGSPKPFADFPVIGNTASPESLSQVQSWLNNCEMSHDTCNQRLGSPQALPKRVLDVSSPHVRLYETRGKLHVMSA